MFERRQEQGLECFYFKYSLHNLRTIDDFHAITISDLNDLSCCLSCFNCILMSSSFSVRHSMIKVFHRFGRYHPAGKCLEKYSTRHFPRLASHVRQSILLRKCRKTHTQPPQIVTN